MRRCTVVIILVAVPAPPGLAQAQAEFGRVVGRNGLQPNALLRFPAKSPDGARIVFTPTARALRWQAPTGDLAPLSRTPDCAIGNALSGTGIGLSTGAATRAFESQAGNLLASDNNGTADVIRRLAAAGHDAIF